MLLNKCYITARYKSQISNFITITLNDKEHLLYIGNFKNTEAIITKLKEDIFFNAICRIRMAYEPEYPEINPRITPECYDYLKQINNPSMIWLEAVKLTTLPESKLYPVKEKGYFSLQDTHQKLFEYINNPNKQLNKKNRNYIIKTHGDLNKNHSINIFRVLSVKSEQISLDELSVLIPEDTTAESSENMAAIENKPLKTFGQYSF